MLVGVGIGTLYRVGAMGATVVYRDGQVVRLAPFRNVVFHRYPLKIEGRLYPISDRGRTGYEAPTLNHSRETK